MLIGELLTLLNNVSGSDGVYRANCPAHIDDKKSLTVRLDDRGIIQLECSRGCCIDDILATLGIQMHDLFSTSTQELPDVKSPLLSLIKNLDEFEERDAEWLVPNWIPKGQISLLSADGGVGKTTIVCNIIAGISSGKQCILDPEGYTREPQKVLFMTSEDSVSAKLKQKLRLAGAAKENVFALDFKSDKEHLLSDAKFGTAAMDEIIRYYKPSLCVFDPVQGFTPPNVNMVSRNAMRDCLAPLITLGEDMGVTSLIVCHTNKRKGAYGRERISDTSDLWDISRSVLMAGYTNDQNMRYLSNEKNNYTQLQQTMLFSINESGLIVPEGTTWKRDAEFIQEKAAQKIAPVRDDCKEFIIDTLKAAGGSMKTKGLEEKATLVGYSGITLRRAKDELKKENRVEYFQTGSAKKGDRIWYITLSSNNFIELPEDTVTPFKD